MGVSRTALLEHIYDVYNRAAWGEHPELIPEDFVYNPPAQGIHPEPVVGRDALLQMFEPDFFERQWVEVGEITENGEHVLVSMRGGGRTVSGATLDQPLFQVWRFEGEVPREAWIYTDRADAERAAGLRD